MRTMVGWYGGRVLRRQAVVGIWNARVADSHFLAAAECRVAERAEAGHGVRVVVAGEVDDAVRTIARRMDYELTGYGDAVRRALRAHDPAALPTVVLSEQERKLPVAYRAGRDLCVGLPWRQHQIALPPEGPRWLRGGVVGRGRQRAFAQLRCGRRVDDDGVGAGARVRAAAVCPHA